MLQLKEVVSCFLECGGKLLLLRRSDRVGSYRGKWATVSGYIEQESPDAQALIEIAEETGLEGTDIRLLKKGEPLEVSDEKMGIKWRVHPYLFAVKDGDKIRLDWEHDEARWIDPRELDSYATVPRLKETLARVYPV